MSFGSPYPYGTPGGDEVTTAPQIPPVIRVGRGNSVVVFLHVNGRLAERLREHVEDVVRILGLTGEILVAIIIRQDNVVRDANAGDLTFDDGLVVTQTAPGVVSITIGNDAITNAMLQDAIVTALELASDAVTTPKIQDGAVTNPKLAVNAVTTSRIVDGSVTNPKLGAASVQASNLANNAVQTASIQDAAVTAAKLAPGAVPPGGTVLLGEYTWASGTSQSFDNVFSSGYDVYMLVGRLTLVTQSFSVNIRMRNGGVDASGSNYRHWGSYLNNPGGSITQAFYQQTSSSNAWFLPGLSGGRQQGVAFHGFITDPAKAIDTELQLTINGIYAGLSWNTFQHTVRHELSTAYDGFSLFSSSQFSGYLRVYGLQNTP